jgi:hypothetical protein
VSENAIALECLLSLCSRCGLSFGFVRILDIDCIMTVAVSRQPTVTQKESGFDGENALKLSGKSDLALRDSCPQDGKAWRRRKTRGSGAKDGKLQSILAHYKCNFKASALLSLQVHLLGRKLFSFCIAKFYSLELNEIQQQYLSFDWPSFP